MKTQLVTFVLANEHYGVDISAVDSIIPLQPIARVPRAPAFVEGVIELRDQVLPVVDLRKRFGLPAGTVTKDTRIVVTAIDTTMVGMLVDAVGKMVTVPKEAIEPPPPLVVTADSAFLTGIAKANGGLVILLDLEKVLSPEEKAELQATPLAAPPEVESLPVPPPGPAEPEAPAPAIAVEETPTEPTAAPPRPTRRRRKKRTPARSVEAPTPVIVGDVEAIVPEDRDAAPPVETAPESGNEA